ncbi:MAG: hypothetical protein RL343_495 [Actinomycetota bacterium]|jgi:uncharacterized protein YgbK (DUF1537 family)
MSAPLVDVVAVSDALQAFPKEKPVDPDEVRKATSSTKRCLVVIDDDPTGSQAVSGIPVITKWQVEDFHWALNQGQSAIFVLLNTRAENEETAKKLNAEAVSNAITAAKKIGIAISFVSRGDSTLRGHFPAETDAIAQALKASGEKPNLATLLIPAFPGAGRVTIDGIHYLKTGDSLTPVGQTEFAKDATFGYSNSNLADFVQEKTHGRILASDVQKLTIETIRTSPEAICEFLINLVQGSTAVVDAVTVDDLRNVALGIVLAEKQNATFLYRTGPTFVAAWIGQRDYEPIHSNELKSTAISPTKGGLIVVGSHVTLTNLQLEQVRLKFPDLTEIEVSPEEALSPTFLSNESKTIVIRLIELLESRNVILRTSRKLITGSTPEDSLDISRRVSNSIANIVHQVLRSRNLKFVIAKGGITSNDVASIGLEVRHATVIGPLLPGLVSLWRPVDGVAVGMPFVVFPGNVGDEFALAKVVEKLSNPEREQSA